MIALKKLLGLLPASLLHHLEVRYQLTSEHQAKLTGETLFVCLLNNLVNHPLVTQRLLKETFAHKTGQQIDHSGIGRALSKVPPDYFRAVFEHLYAKLA